VRGVLRLAPFRRLLAAYTLNELAWAFSLLALSYLVYRRTNSALGAAAFYQTTLIVPALIAPLLVARLDHLHPRLVLPPLYALEALAYLSLALIARHTSVAIVLVITTLDGVIALAARSFSRAVTVAVSSPVGLLREANALTNTMFTICFMAGPSIAGAVVVAGGTTAVLLINAGLFVAITAVLASARDLPAPAETERPNKRGRVRAAIKYTKRQPAVRTLMGLQSVLMLFFSLSVPVEVVFATHTLHTGAGGYGALVTAWGAGAVAGSTVYARWRRLPARELIVLGSVLLGVGLTVMAVAPSLLVALAASVIAGIGNGIFIVAARTAVQEAVEEQWMAVMMSFNESLGQHVPGLGILLGGLLATLEGPRTALAVGGVGALVLTAGAWFMLRPSPRPRRAHIERPAHDQA
jgi:predicted MFS family arabinose efflux permease